MSHIVVAREAEPNLSATLIEVLPIAFDVTEDVAGDPSAITLNDPQTIEYIGVGFYLQETVAGTMAYVPHSSFSSSDNTIQLGINALQSKLPFKQDGTPTDANEGDTWYDTDDNVFRLYLETSPGTIEWVTLAGTLTNSMTSVNGGAF